MGEQPQSKGTIEDEQSDEMFQTREHTTLPGFSGHGSSSSYSSWRCPAFCRAVRAEILIAVILLGLIIVAFLTYRDTSASSPLPTWTASPRNPAGLYLSQSSYLKYSPDSSHYRIAMISDMDTSSHIDKSLVFKAEVVEGRLTRVDGKYKVEWDLTTLIKGEYNEKGRGMELSELVHYNNMLLTCDDRTGIVYEVSLDQKLVIPRWILPSGDGRTTAKGMKCEWMTVKDDVLYAGSIGKEYVRNGKIVSQENTWVKMIDRAGGVHHADWKIIYDKLRTATGTEYPGYIVHEAIGWSQQLRKWVFLPRRMSTEEYDEKLDESKGSNTAFLFNEDFTGLKQITLGPQTPTHGFSSFKFVPWRENEIIALKSVENGDTIKTFMTAFNLNTGEVLMEETEVSSNTKFEGLEFL